MASFLLNISALSIHTSTSRRPGKTQVLIHLEMPRRRSRSRSVHRRFDYHSESEYSEYSDNEHNRGRPIINLFNLRRPRPRSTSVNIYNNNYNGDNNFDEDNVYGAMYQAGDRGWAAQRRAGNNRGGNHLHHHQHRRQDDSDDSSGDDNHGCGHCHCGKCEAAQAARAQKEKKAKAKKAAEEAAKRIQKENDDLEKRLKALEMGGSRRLIRDRVSIDLDVANCNRNLYNVMGMQRHLRRSRSRSRPGVRWEDEEEVTEIYADA